MQCKYCKGIKHLNIICDDCLAKLPTKPVEMAMMSTAEMPSYVRGIRKQLGMRQNNFASQLGVSPNTVARWEAGRIKPSGESIDRLLALTKSIINKQAKESE